MEASIIATRNKRSYSLMHIIHYLRMHHTAYYDNKNKNYDYYRSRKVVVARMVVNYYLLAASTTTSLLLMY